MEPLRASFQQRRWSSFNKSLSNLSVSFSVGTLKDLLLKVIPICQGVDRLCCQHVVELIWRHNGAEVPNDELEETACFLEGLLSPSYDHLDKTLLVHIHSCIGMIREQQGVLDRAIRSLQLALWLQQKVTTDQVALAVTEHRLGLVYAKMGDYKKATYLIERALKAYSDAKLKTGHTCIVEAEESLSGIRINKLMEDMEMQRSVSEHLAGIMEDDDQQQDQEQRQEPQQPKPKRKPKKHVLRARSA
ncbi:expressed unknown protein [Seminavis robusta]|uniref:Uncharacterized protein n=1 Tax=Seminavis robusta TaxID=568900 RepID=A0A9N8HP35_9STRA|nr:expressed unknown protein [Seminavis robusta]|eukprot:Sro1284_g259260.1 n/a (246) ;mRNA; f:30190-30927